MSFLLAWHTHYTRWWGEESSLKDNGVIAGEGKEYKIVSGLLRRLEKPDNNSQSLIFLQKYLHKYLFWMPKFLCKFIFFQKPFTLCFPIFIYSLLLTHPNNPTSEWQLDEKRGKSQNSLGYSKQETPKYILEKKTRLILRVKGILETSSYWVYKDFLEV